MTTATRPVVQGTVHVVLPDDVDDPALPSGGNAYDRRVCRGLACGGWAVEEIAVGGSWPRPDGAARAALRRALDGLPDGAVVLLDGLVACGVPDVVVPQAGRLALVVLVHLPLGDEEGGTEEDRASLADAERAVLHAAAAVVATSPWTAARLADVHGLAGVHVARPGVDPVPLARGSGGAGRLMCVGSVSPTKGQDVLVAALATVVDLPWTCALVGPLRRDPAHVARVRAAIDGHGLAGRVRLTGPLTGPPLDAAYDTADLLVVPSRAEAYGMVVTEALARGVPVLGSAVGGIPESVGGDAGLLVPPGDAGALAGALRRWFADPDLRDRLRSGAAARRDVLDGWEVTIRCLAAVLRRCGTRG
ncbi:glycosyltransferase family 4 protein [Pseudonocardia sp.]|uniref:glycosyltransferase family 4 protein n=1 Tax=Pseudonocardia sp. TaxID=60912 RepID=UPI00261FF2B7|nr:glycosyltransferase family 4 protein [Pseudonocardia sp.]